MKKLIILILPLFLTGCWNYRELNDMAIVSAIAIDKANDTYEVSVQIMNAKKGSSESGTSTSSNTNPITVLNVTGKTMHEALRNIVLQSPYKLYIGHMELIIIDESVAYDGISNIIDFFLRDPESRKQFKVLISKDSKASDIIKIITPLENFPTQDLIKTINNADVYESSIREISYDELLATIYAEGIEAVLPASIIIGSTEEGNSAENTESSETKTNIILDNLAVFNDDTLVGFLDKNDGIGYNFITNNISYGVISFKCDEKNYAATEIIESSSDFTVSIEQNLPKAIINVKTIAYLSELNCNNNITTKKGLEKIEEMAEKQIKKMIESSIETVQKQFGTDIFGFGQYLYRNNQEYWNENSYNWNNLFINLDYEINVDLLIKRKGSILEGAKEE
ncbi:MAG: Ger(x)C family spore germination protein [Bacilli bacterium]|nr:Ger(x)C family spore germination protein [Bacilli bacterium]